MLRELFEGTGVLSAMDHTKIEGANDPEALSLDAQAAKVARRAADAVRRSRNQVQVPGPSFLRAQTHGWAITTPSTCPLMLLASTVGCLDNCVNSLQRRT